MQFETINLLSGLTERFDHRIYLPIKELVPLTVSHNFGTLKELFKEKLENAFVTSERHNQALGQIQETILQELRILMKIARSIVPSQKYMVLEALQLYFEDDLKRTLEKVYGMG